MGQIQLVGKYSNYCMFVDDDIVKIMSVYRWQRGVSGKRIFYAQMGIYCHGYRYTIFAHRYAAMLYGILISWDRKIDARFIDHIDHNGLNNKRDNLRAVTISDNARNQRKRNGCTSCFRGISWDSWGNRWRATISNNFKRCHLGSFKNEIEAATTWDNEAIKLGYIDSSLNFPRRDNANHNTRRN